MLVDVHAEDEKGNVYTLMEEVHYCGLTVPVGFDSDGASVPRLFWRLVFPPGDSHALRAAIIHDYIYRIHPKGWSKSEADCAFYSLLVEDGVSWWRALLAFFGVALFGLPSWRRGGSYEG